MTETELSIKEHNQNIAEAEKELAEKKADAAAAKFPKFPDIDLIKEHEENVASAERALAKAKADAVFVKETEVHATLKEHEEKVADAEKALAEARAAAEHQEFPKWVMVHDSHVHRLPAKDGAPEHVSVPGYAHYHVDAKGVVTVLVDDADEEAKAAGAAAAVEKKDL